MLRVWWYNLLGDWDWGGQLELQAKLEVAKTTLFTYSDYENEEKRGISSLMFHLPPWNSRRREESGYREDKRNHLTVKEPWTKGFRLFMNPWDRK